MLKDAEVTGEAGEFEFDQSQTIKYVRTMSELQQQMVKFCMPLVNGYEKQCAIQLREYLYQFMEEHLNVPETDAPRIILYYQNRSKFEAVLRRVMDDYTNKIQKERRMPANALSRYTHGKFRRNENTMMRRTIKSLLSVMCMR